MQNFHLVPCSFSFIVVLHCLWRDGRSFRWGQPASKSLFSDSVPSFPCYHLHPALRFWRLQCSQSRRCPIAKSANKQFSMQRLGYLRFLSDFFFFSFLLFVHTPEAFSDLEDKMQVCKIDKVLFLFSILHSISSRLVRGQGFIIDDPPGRVWNLVLCCACFWGWRDGPPLGLPCIFHHRQSSMHGRSTNLASQFFAVNMQVCLLPVLKVFVLPAGTRMREQELWLLRGLLKKWDLSCKCLRSTVQILCFLHAQVRKVSCMLRRMQGAGSGYVGGCCLLTKKHFLERH